MYRERSTFRKRLFIYISFFLVIFTFPVFSEDHSSQSGPLFTDAVINGADTALSRSAIYKDDPQVIRKRLVTVNFGRLCQMETPARSTQVRGRQGDKPFHPYLELNLFEDVNLKARVHRVEKVFSGGFSCIGDIEGVPGSEAILVVTGDILSANISVPGHFYQVRCSVDGTHAIREIDQGQFPLELPGVPVQVVTPTEPDPGAAGDSGSYIDILVVYTAEARSAAGGTTAMENLIDLAVNETNTGYSNSGVSQRLRLVHTAEVDYSEAGFNWSTTLTRLRQDGEGYMDEVHTLRDTYGADEVVLIVNDTGYCGIAYVMQVVTTAFAPYAFAVVSRTCATGYYSFAHELGHNMGCAHDRDNAGVSGAYSYAYGYQAPDEAFRTIMSYNCPGGCTRVNYWSNPDKQYGGQPMGVDYTDPLAADNRRALNNTAYTVANFKQAGTGASITVTSPDGGETLTAGTTHTITWTTTGTVGDVKIQYSTNNGSSWSTAVSSTANDGTYYWTVPDVDSIQCLVRVSEASDGSPSDTSDTVFSVVPASSSTLTVTNPNGGETLTAGDRYTISWTSTGTVGNVKIQYSTNNGSSWQTVVSSAANDGGYSWVVPDVNSSQCKIRISEAADGSPSDTSDNVFSIEPAVVSTLIVTSPNGGESLEAGTSHAITWSSGGTVGNVKIEYSTDNGGSWSIIKSSAANDGTYSWSVPGVESSGCLVKISEASDGSPSDTSNSVFTIYSPTPPEIALNRTQLYFGADTAGRATGNQSILIDNSGGGTLKWSTSSNASWLSVSPGSGTGSGVISVSVNPSGLAAGTYTGAAAISANDAANSPQHVSVSLKIYNSGSTSEPFGDFSTPTDGSTVRASVPVTGWVIDDIEVKKVKIYNGSDYIGDAVFVEGARPDVENAYPGYPKNYQAGWGYMMLTHFLPGGGNGTYTIYAKATDAEGNQVTLGSKTITVDNANGAKPFGAIDTPGQGGTASGSSFINWGWVLTPQPNTIPLDGSTIDVIVDGVKIGNPNYNVYRADIAGLFPSYNNSNGAIGYFYLDTTAYENGVHTIQWLAADDAGNTDGIGSRYFAIQNTGNDALDSALAQGRDTGRQVGRGGPSGSPITRSRTLAPLWLTGLHGIPADYSTPIRFRKGGNQNIEPQTVYPDDNGNVNIEIRELERIEIRLTPENASFARCFGFMAAGERLKPLPVGSSLDIERGVFYWSPGPGFVGKYELVFVDTLRNRLRRVNIAISPRYFLATKRHEGTRRREETEKRRRVEYKKISLRFPQTFEASSLFSIHITRKRILPTGWFR